MSFLTGLDNSIMRGVQIANMKTNMQRQEKMDVRNLEMDKLRKQEMTERMDYVKFQHQLAKDENHRANQLRIWSGLETHLNGMQVDEQEQFVRAFGENHQNWIQAGDGIPRELMGAFKVPQQDDSQDDLYGFELMVSPPGREPYPAPMTNGDRSPNDKNLKTISGKQLYTMGKDTEQVLIQNGMGEQVNNFKRMISLRKALLGGGQSMSPQQKMEYQLEIDKRLASFKSALGSNQVAEKSASNLEAIDRRGAVAKDVATHKNNLEREGGGKPGAQQQLIEFIMRENNIPANEALALVNQSVGKPRAEQVATWFNMLIRQQESVIGSNKTTTDLRTEAESIVNQLNNYQASPSPNSGAAGDKEFDPDSFVEGLL